MKTTTIKTTMKTTTMKTLGIGIRHSISVGKTPASEIVAATDMRTSLLPPPCLFVSDPGDPVEGRGMGGGYMIGAGGSKA